MRHNLTADIGITQTGIANPAVPDYSVASYELGSWRIMTGEALLLDRVLTALETGGDISLYGMHCRGMKNEDVAWLANRLTAIRDQLVEHDRMKLLYESEAAG